MQAGLVFRRILLTLAIAVYGLLVPYLEIGPTHVFNPEWPPHARLHEVWQLITNCVIAATCAWLAWTRSDLRVAARIGIIAPLSFLAAFATMGHYGGSMVHSDGTEFRLAGWNASFLIMAICALVLGYLALARPKAGGSTQ